MRAAEKDQTHALRHFFANEVADEGSRLTDLLGRHLCIVRGIHHDAQKRVGISQPHEGGRLTYPMDERSHISRCVGAGCRNKQMAKTLACKLVSDLHECVFMPVTIARCVSVLTVAETVIQNARRSVGEAT